MAYRERKPIFQKLRCVEHCSARQDCFVGGVLKRNLESPLLNLLPHMRTLNSSGHGCAGGAFKMRGNVSRFLSLGSHHPLASMNYVVDQGTEPATGANLVSEDINQY
jgi:hypothetical protein